MKSHLEQESKGSSILQIGEQLNEKQQTAVHLLTLKLDELTTHLKEFLHLKKQQEQAQGENNKQEEVEQKKEAEEKSQ